MSIATEKNSEIYIAVVGWVLLAWGVYGAYYSATQSILQFAFSDEALTINLDAAMSIVVASLQFLFPIAAIWLGLGLLKRNLAAYRSASLIGWLYILSWWTLTIVAVVTMFYATSLTEDLSAEVVQAFREARTVQLAYSTQTWIRLLAESALILWVLSNLKSDVIRREFYGD